MICLECFIKDLRVNEVLAGVKRLSWIQEDLLVQIELFERFQLEDEAEAKGEYDMENLNDAFRAVCMRNQFSANNSQQLLEILKLLFQIEDSSQEDTWAQATNALRQSILFKGILSQSFLNIWIYRHFLLNDTTLN